MKICEFFFVSVPYFYAENNSSLERFKTTNVKIGNLSLCDVFLLGSLNSGNF
jgi:hypothetical protein